VQGPLSGPASRFSLAGDLPKIHCAVQIAIAKIDPRLR
jgi:hypothetical protein